MSFNDRPLIYLIDFEDSFSHNILFYLNEMNCSFKMISINNLDEELVHEIKEHASLLIWGPGPGHVLDYKKYQRYFLDLIGHKKLFHFGICLGHQMLWSLLGGNIRKSGSLIHGRAVSIKIPKWRGIFAPHLWNQDYLVQRYNSWEIEQTSDLDVSYLMETGTDSILGFYGQNLLGFQFHPESIGTSCPSSFFDWIAAFLYNKMDDKPIDPNRGDLRQRNIQVIRFRGDSNLQL